MKLLLLLSPEDQPYIHLLKNLLTVGAGHVISFDSNYTMKSEIESKASGFDAVVTSNHKIASLVFGIKFKAPKALGTGATLDDYAGSIKALPKGKEVLIINPLQHLITTDTGKFLLSRYLSKFLKPEVWFKQTLFEYSVIRNSDYFNAAELWLSNSFAIAIDIETGDNQKIKMIGFSGIVFKDSKFHIKTFVLPLTDELSVAWMRQLCALPASKIFQNGLFDNSQLLGWRTPVNNWMWDTMGLFHSWYSELPRRLDFIGSFLLRNVEFWKDDAAGGNVEDEYKYNARDCWVTANAFLAFMAEAPQSAIENYKIKFPEVFPCLQCSMEGLAVDELAKARMKETQEQALEKELASLQQLLSCPGFNPNSPKQVLQLLHLLGDKTATNADDKALEKTAGRHPLNALIIGKIQNYRGASKLLSTYVNAPLLRGRLLYSINPFGTETGRMASKKSHFYKMQGKVFKSYGAQIQNMPPYAKQMLKADSGWLLAEIDKKSSESYCTAALSQDENLWRVIHTAPDFHKANASLFFGLEPQNVTKELRQLSKKVNHGANYNMGPGVLVDTMGEANAWKAKALLIGVYRSKSDAESRKLLGLLLDCNTTKKVAQFLLDRFDAAYPRIKGRWYSEVVSEVISTKQLRSPSGWTRTCFGNPKEDKRYLNAMVAHGPQHLSVCLLNRGFIQIFNELQNADNFRLKAQIHDSILFQYKEGREDLVIKAEAMLKTPIKIHGKIMDIPNDISHGKLFWSDLK